MAYIGHNNLNVLMAHLRVPFYDIKAQYTELSAELDQAVHEVISSGVYSMGPHHNAFEREMADRHGAKHGVALNSGTDALRIMMDAAGIGPGDEVITTAFTFVASVETIVQTGATPVFVDIDPETYMMDAAQIEAAITHKTKAILPIHLFGQLANVEAITKLADQYSLIVIEDGAQAVDATYQGKHTGKFGVGSGLSFYVTKNLGAAGDAGFILTDDDNFAATCRSIRVHGMGRERYYYDHLGYTARMHEMQAAVLRVKLTRLSQWNERRAVLAAQYLEGLDGLPGVRLPKVSEGNVMTWHQFSIQTPRRSELMTHLKESGVDSMIYYPVPIHFHSPYRAFGHGENSLPETERVSREVLNLPIHAHLDTDQVNHVIQCIRDFLGS